jgi:glycogen operon protein
VEDSAATRSIDLERGLGHLWHAEVKGVRAGQLYAYRVHGDGPRFDPSRTLLDPYARLIVGDISAGLGRCRLVESRFDWGDDRPPRTPWGETVIYEAHVKGLTKLHPQVVPSFQGTYAAVASESVVNHLKRLGVTAVELLPVHAFVDEPRLRARGLRNYWGYNSIGFFAPELRYSASGTIDEFKSMVKALHAAGLELILDVVYNHTGEGDADGPNLCFRGIDDATYYRLKDRSYENFTGTGNTFNVAHPVVRRLVLDSLRYWVEEMHVDGFRFDLAPVLARQQQGYEQDSEFFSEIQSDPILSQVKLIAEPWDLGPGGYRLGAFPDGWREWNDRYRDAARRFWRGDEGMLRGLAARIGGSPDLFGQRAPGASINFVTAHDGFTLHDLVSYARNRNEANGEDGKDGADENYSKDWGSENIKFRMKKNLLATLLLSRGVPMLLAGDELGHTQRGNNNAYCQDNEISWLKWQRSELSEVIAQLVSIRKCIREDEQLVWLAPEGREMTDEDWQLPYARCVGMRSGRLLVLLNAHDGAIDFTLPPGEWAETAERSYRLEPRSVAVLTPRSSTPSRTDG